MRLFCQVTTKLPCKIFRTHFLLVSLEPIQPNNDTHHHKAPSLRTLPKHSLELRLLLLDVHQLLPDALSVLHTFLFLACWKQKQANLQMCKSATPKKTTILTKVQISHTPKTPKFTNVQISHTPKHPPPPKHTHTHTPFTVTSKF